MTPPPEMPQNTLHGILDETLPVRGVMKLSGVSQFEKETSKAIAAICKAAAKLGGIEVFK